MIYACIASCVVATTMLGAADMSTPFTSIGAGRHGTAPIPLGEQMPDMCTHGEQMSASFHTPPGEITMRWSRRELPEWPDGSKVTAPRILLAKLAANRDVELVNKYLLAAEPASGVGSTWFLHEGDYDFTLVTLTTLLYLFGQDSERLYPETRAHLLSVLLNQEGGMPLVTVPITFGLLLDTENHHLMTEGSRYLKNQWLAAHGTDEQRTNPDYDNRANGLGDWLESYLDEMISEGVYEFNSRPYIRFTLQALLNLEAFPARPAIRHKARYLIDIMNLQYALGSLDLRRNAPFRRQYEKAGDTLLNNDPHTAYMHAWLRLSGVADGAGEAWSRYTSQGLVAELLPYRLPDDLVRWTRRKPAHYFARFGRGPSACPEIYSGGPGYLISAGGAHRGLRSHIVARPVTLLLGDGADDSMNTIHLRGNGLWQTWNNTGVYRHFACTNGSIHVPGTFSPDAENEHWRVFRAPETPDLLIAAHKNAGISLLALFPESERSPDALLQAITEANPDADLLRTQFTRPDGGELTYDVDAPKGVWVMRSADGVPLDRNYDDWPQLEGDLPSVSFRR